MKRLTLLLGALLLTAAALAQTAVPPTVRIAHGPYVLNVTEDGFTVVWDAKADAIGWVELAPMDGSHFYSAERPRYYDSHLGLCRVGRMHRVRIEGLQPGTTYRYRIMQRGIVLNEGNRRVILDDGDGSEVYRRKPYTIRTLDPAQEKVDFWMVNDIHARDSVFQLLIKEAPEAQPDFVCLNGDLLIRPKPRRRSSTDASRRRRSCSPRGHPPRRDARQPRRTAAPMHSTGSTISPHRPAKVTIRSAAVPSSSSYSTAARTNPTATSAITGFRPPTLTANSRRSGSGA